MINIAICDDDVGFAGKFEMILSDIAREETYHVTLLGRGQLMK